MTLAKALSDFNDLAHAVSKVEVAHQIQFAIDNPKPFIAIQNTAENTPQIASNDESAPVPPMPDLPPTPESEWQDRLQGLLRRYAQIHDDVKKKITNRVYDLDQKMEMNKSLFTSELADAKLVKTWWSHPKKKTITSSEINQDRDSNTQVIIKDMVDRYILIYGTKDVWDDQDRQRFQCETIKMAHPIEYDLWLKSPTRKMVKQENIWFDPTRKRQTDYKEDISINTFNGLPLKPLQCEYTEAWKKAMPILQLLKHLCEDDDKVFRWVLNWIAIPLQNTGTKMDTALLFHGHHQGAGKSLFFNVILKRIYGDYARKLSQGDLSGQYNDWVCDKLYVLFEEIFSGSNRYSNMGFIKDLITGDTLYISKKFMSGWDQDNHVNVVFLSNDLMPLSLEADDRRHVVCYPQKKVPPNLLKKIEEALDDDSQKMLRAFYTVLLTLDTMGQTRHTPAIKTKSKEHLIRLSQPNWQTFYDDWSSNLLAYPYKTCTSHQLYRAYKYWCRENGENPTTQTRIMRFIGTRENKSKIKHSYSGTKTSMMICIDVPLFPTETGEKQQSWYTKQVANFQASLDIITERLPHKIV